PLTSKGLTAMSKRNSYHVTHNKGNDNWQVKKAGGQRSSGVFDTQAEAIDAARGFAKKSDLGQVVVHRKDNNQIRTEFTYGNDPFPPAG
ncbi:MAG: DUF2188 domain-containing protein, partial [Candidatus Obscuribacterales bacterium]|nr:DUF2188 domain-containing protein [Candidatus Obscuribacterales bacterium]